MAERKICDKITSNIFLGDFWAAYEKKFLKENGVTAILTCGKGMKSFYPKDFIYKTLQIDDIDYEDILSLFEECFQFIESNEKVLIHCQMGVSRSPSITISYLMKKNKWKYEEAFAFVKSSRSLISPNEGFEENEKNVWREMGWVMEKCADDIVEEIRKLKTSGAYNFREGNICDKITSNIFLGDFCSAHDKRFLNENGITAILICGKGMKSVYPSEFIYKTLQIDDIDNEDISALFEDCFKFIESNEKVLIHCQMGISRSPSITISYLMKKNKWKYEEALAFVKSRRSLISPNEGFVKQLKEWEKQIFS